MGRQEQQLQQLATENQKMSLNPFCCIYKADLLMKVKEGAQVDSRVTKLAQSYRSFKGTSVKKSFIRSRQTSWQSCLETIAPFLENGPSFWWDDKPNMSTFLVEIATNLSMTKDLAYVTSDIQIFQLFLTEASVPGRQSCRTKLRFQQKKCKCIMTMAITFPLGM